MARISDEEIQRLKSAIALERLAQAAGVRLKRHGKDLVGRCPFHDDREPSLVITPGRNLWHCLGECQAGGTVIDWVMRAESVSFRHAVELLRERHLPSLAAEEPPRPVKRSTAQKLPATLERDASDEALLRQVVDYYHQSLKESPEALEYLEKRGLRDEALIEHFQLGFANRTLAYRLPHKKRVAGAELRGRLQALGILRESGHEHLNGSLVFPVFDEEGRVVEMYGRKIGTALRKGTPLHLYLPGPHRGVWNWEALRDAKEIVLCESLIDAATFWCAGFRNVTAAYGVEGFTEDHWAAFRKHGTERVLIAYDHDDAGDRAAERLRGALEAAGLQTARLRFPKDLDANAYALKVQPARKSLGLVVRQASPSLEPAAFSPPRTPEKAAKRENESPADVVTAPPNRDASEPPLSLAADIAASADARVEASNDDEVVYRFGDRRWRVRGLGRNASIEQLRVNLFVARESNGAERAGGFHVDTLELYSARQRASYVAQAALELGVEERVVKRDLGEVLLRLEERQEAERRAAKEPKAKKKALTEAERREALELLRDPRLIDRILEDFERCGVVGETTNKLTGYLAATSRKLEQPLAVVIQSCSAAGKSSLMDAVLSLMPEEERVSYSAMTGQSLFYMGETDLQHKILAIVEEEGAERASYALKLLQSEGELTIASTGKDPASGRLVTEEYRVTGPVMIFLTTTAVDVDEELLNRCLVLTVDEGREQTRAIHERQRQAQTLEGLLGRAERQRVMERHQNAQRLIDPLLVANPFAHELRFIDTQTRTRRDFPKYLTLIRTIALLHQHQRPVQEIEHAGGRVRYIEVERSDIELGNRLCHEVLGRTLDELPPGTRKLLGLLDALVTAECERHGMDRGDYRFSRREVREHTGWGNTQLKVHLGRLVEMEYLAVHRGRQGQGFLYELAWAGEGLGGDRFVPGLVDAAALGTDGTTETSRGAADDFAGGGRAPVGPRSGGGRRDSEAAIEHQSGSDGDRAEEPAPAARLGTVEHLSSYLRIADDGEPRVAHAAR